MKYLRSTVTGAIVLGCFLVASQAHAVLVTFDFNRGDVWTGDPLVFVNGSNSVSVSAEGSSLIGSNGSGLVVCSGGAGNIGGNANGCTGDQHLIDNRGGGVADEFVKFTFGPGLDVSLDRIDLRFFGGNDDFSVRVPGGGGDFNELTNFDLSLLAVGGMPGGLLPNNMVRIGASGPDNNDEFKLRSLTVDITTPPPPPPPVATPEPSTILLFGSGLVGLGLLRMRKRN